MILGIGTDLIELGRFREVLDRHGSRFLEKLFTDRERAYCGRYRDPLPHYAGRFCAKEALVKALGGWHSGSWLDFEILSEVSGKPVVVLSESLQEIVGQGRLLVTISHSRDYAQAFALWEQ